MVIIRKSETTLEPCRCCHPKTATTVASVDVSATIGPSRGVNILLRFFVCNFWTVFYGLVTDLLRGSYGETDVIHCVHEKTAPLDNVR